LERFFGETFQGANQSINNRLKSTLKTLLVTTMSFEELQSSVESFSVLKAILWCFYPMSVLIVLEFLARIVDDDDDQDGGKMVPILQGAQ